MAKEKKQSKKSKKLEMKANKKKNNDSSISTSESLELKKTREAEVIKLNEEKRQSQKDKSSTELTLDNYRRLVEPRQLKMLQKKKISLSYKVGMRMSATIWWIYGILSSILLIVLFSGPSIAFKFINVPPAPTGNTVVDNAITKAVNECSSGASLWGCVKSIETALTDDVIEVAINQIFDGVSAADSITGNQFDGLNKFLKDFCTQIEEFNTTTTININGTDVNGIVGANEFIMDEFVKPRILPDIMGPDLNKNYLEYLNLMDTKIAANYPGSNPLPKLVMDDVPQLALLPMDILPSSLSADSLINELIKPKDKGFTWVGYIKSFANGIEGIINSELIANLDALITSLQTNIIGDITTPIDGSIRKEKEKLDKWFNKTGNMVTNAGGNLGLIQPVIDDAIAYISDIQTAMDDFILIIDDPIGGGIIQKVQDAIGDPTNPAPNTLRWAVKEVNIMVTNIVDNDPTMATIDKYYTIVVVKALPIMQTLPWILIILGIANGVVFGWTKAGKIKTKWFSVFFALLACIVPGILLMIGKKRELDDVFLLEKKKLRMKKK